YELAAALSEAGWRHLHEHLRYNDDGFLVHEIERHLENHYWTEAVKLFETVLAESNDPALLNDSTYSLTLLYCNLGEYEKGLALAERMAPLCYSRELLRSCAVDGAEKSRYEGASLLALAHEFANQMVYTLMSKESNFQSDLPVRMLTKTIELLEGLFDGGTMGAFHAVVSELRLYLSEHQWRCGMHDEAFASLDEALAHAKAYDALLADETEHPYTSPLLENVPLERARWVPGETAPTLADHWPIWLMPEYDDVAAEITADPRWDEWVKRCRARDAEK
ncbi:MAG: hypothetical protein ACI4V1_08760, partial [Eubacteriales bacterium]